MYEQDLSETPIFHALSRRESDAVEVFHRDPLGAPIPAPSPAPPPAMNPMPLHAVPTGARHRARHRAASTSGGEVVALAAHAVRAAHAARSGESVPAPTALSDDEHGRRGGRHRALRAVVPTRPFGGM